jgi:lytic murein transglycosylase
MSPTILTLAASAIVVADLVGVGVFTSLGFQVMDISSGFTLLLLWFVGGIVALNAVFLYTTPIEKMSGQLMSGQLMSGQLDVALIGGNHIFGEWGGRIVGTLICFGLVSAISAMMWIGPRVTMAMLRKCKMGAVAFLASAMLAGPGTAATNCQNTGNFNGWVEAFKAEAAAQGISRTIISATLDRIALDADVIRRDRAQRIFQQDFLEFSDRMVSNYRLLRGAALMKQHQTLFARIERELGVPAPVIVAIWGLESDFGINTGKFNVVRSLATLAYDCRRPLFFRRQLMDAMRILQRGDLKIDKMIGNWAGELGPMQITTSDYFRAAVDFDGDGKRDAISSMPDTLASAANLLVGFGWRRGEPWLQEVRVADNLPWDQADPDIQHPRSQWVAWGVTAAQGKLAADDVPASLILPMGRLGPAFLAYQNFRAILAWNAATVYSTTVAYAATRLAGTPPVGRGNGVVVVPTMQQVEDLQRLMIQYMLMTGEADGQLGPMTRAAVKQAQIKVGLPADSYPTQELINRLRAEIYANSKND